MYTRIALKWKVLEQHELQMLQQVAQTQNARKSARRAYSLKYVSKQITGRLIRRIVGYYQSADIWTYHCLWEFTVDILHQLQELVHLWRDGKRQIMYLRMYVCTCMYVLPCMHTHYNTNLKQTQGSCTYMHANSHGQPTHTHTNTSHSLTYSMYVHTPHTPLERLVVWTACAIQWWSSNRPDHSLRSPSQATRTSQTRWAAWSKQDSRRCSVLQKSSMYVHLFVKQCTLEV